MTNLGWNFELVVTPMHRLRVGHTCNLRLHTCQWQEQVQVTRFFELPLKLSIMISPCIYTFFRWCQTLRARTSRYEDEDENYNGDYEALDDGDDEADEETHQEDTNIQCQVYQNLSRDFVRVAGATTKSAQDGC
jgi:hypothetical protein